MDKRILQSIASLALVLALGGGATFALFTSNTATISGNTIATGSADLRLCDEADDQWSETINPAMSLNGLLPGDEEELTTGKTLHLGNDDGNLNDNITVPSAQCDNGSNGTSTTTMKMIPSVNNLSCDSVPDLDNQISIKFIIGGVDSGYGSLEFWDTNTGTYGPDFAPGDHNQVKVFAKLDSASNEQGHSCTFDIAFVGQQVTPI